MKVRHSMPMLAAIVGGVAAMGFALPAQAAGDTGRYHGCAAHWRNTATWNECVNAPAGTTVRLEVDCNNQVDWEGDYKKVSGSVNPLDRFACAWKANSAWLGFK